MDSWILQIILRRFWDFEIFEKIHESLEIYASLEIHEPLEFNLFESLISEDSYEWISTNDDMKPNTIVNAPTQSFKSENFKRHIESR